MVRAKDGATPTEDDQRKVQPGPRAAARRDVRQAARLNAWGRGTVNGLPLAFRSASPIAMCGRYVLYGPHSRLREYFDLRDSAGWVARYNIAPRSEILVVRERPGVGRVGQLVRWGLIPHWAKDASIGLKLNNARAETVAAKPSFKASFARHRCLIPANGFYEWQSVSEGGKSRKQPWYIRPDNDDGLFAMAGLLAAWKSPEGRDIVSACIITTAANALMAPIHDRMPVLLAAERFADWLDPAFRDVATLGQWLLPAPAEGMRAQKVSPRVSNARNEGADLIDPVQQAKGVAP